MNNLTRIAEERSLFAFAMPMVLIVGWLIFSGLLFAAITRPAALDASIQTTLAHGNVPSAPAREAEARVATAMASQNERCACNTR